MQYQGRGKQLTPKAEKEKKAKVEERWQEEVPGLNVIRQDLLVHVPSGKIIICR